MFETKLEELTKLVPLYTFVTDDVVMFAVCTWYVAVNLICTDLGDMFGVKVIELLYGIVDDCVDTRGTTVLLPVGAF